MTSTSFAFTLLSDGSSDRALLPVLRRLLEEHLPGVALEAQWADLRPLRQPPKALPDRLRTALALYPCRLLFVHRDAEGQGWRDRTLQIRKAVEGARLSGTQLPPVVSAVPVRMLEAWLLVDEAAIRRAAGNPHGTEPLDLPKVDALELLADPKAVLHDALRAACGLSGVRRKRFPVHARSYRVAELIPDLAPLRRLDAFRRMEADLEKAIADF